jgi:hypothetical protein
VELVQQGHKGDKVQMDLKDHKDQKENLEVSKVMLNRKFALKQKDK